MDDEDLVRKTCVRMLARMGFEVLQAQSGEEAISLYSEEWESISLVLLDMVMPTMSGSKTFKQLREVNPDAKVIVSSGYPEDEVIKTMLAQGAVGFVKKPFGLQELADELDKVVA
ncbi:MAG: response regulator [Deltaproteobacteria bacterium]|nr:response regulator [Deltaproteobacteria bacterium]MBN2674030.1 response regulator [Deltaproteobacteria bacterium]